MNENFKTKTGYDEYFESLKKIPGINIEKMINSLNQNNHCGVRFNTKKLSVGEINDRNLEHLLNKCGINCKLKTIPWCKQGFYFDNEVKLGKNLLHEMGTYYLQEPSAMAPVEFLNIKEDDLVLDLCASPGGKATQIAEKLNNENGLLIANEIIPKRAKILAENIQRLGLGNTVVINHSPKELENMFCEFFDKILVDAPCSGEGMFRKNDTAIAEWNTNTPSSCATRQKEIVESAFKMLKCGGKMVYSTCTFSLEENEGIIHHLLKNHPELKLVKIEHKKYNFNEGITIYENNELKNCARLYPYNIEGEGHFLAVLEKKKNVKSFECNKDILDTKLLKNDKKIAKFNKKMQNYSQFVKIFKEFEHNFLNTDFKNFEIFGDDIYANSKMNLDTLKVESVGVHLGKFKNNMFIPSLHLAHFLKPSQCKQTYDLNETSAKKYLEGYEFDAKIDNGWVLLTYCNMPLCFGKATNGKIKNHYPKNLRKKV